MANNLCKKLCLVFIFLSIFFVSFILGWPSLDRNTSERNVVMKKSGGFRGGARGFGGGARGFGGGGARGFRGGARGSGGGGRGRGRAYGGSGVMVIPLYRRSRASRGSYCSLALVLAAAAVGAAIL